MIQSIPTTYAGCTYRSRTEARWAVWFDAVGLRFQYEAEGFSIRSGYYLPDFWIADWNMFFEVKGAEPTEEECRKCAELSELAECDVLLAIGAPEERFQLIWFVRGDEQLARFVIARDKFSAAGFWLVGSDEFGDVARPIGPNRTPFLPRGPMFTGALEEAFAAARSARFERGDGRVRHPVIAEVDPARLEHPTMRELRGAA